MNKSYTAGLTYTSSRNKNTRKNCFYIILIIVLINFFGSHQALASNNGWKTIRSDSINIHFQENNEASARYLIGLYSLYIPFFEKTFNHKPDNIDVVLLDNLDISNGSSTPIPHNINKIYLLPPIDGQLISQQNWLDLVARHEITHLYHLDAASGAPKSLRNALGRFIYLFPAIFQTLWGIEGLAVFHETDQRLGYGRGAAGYFDAIMRVELDKGFRSLTSTSYNVRSQPVGSPYYYGYYFYEFLQATYGQNILEEYVNSYNDRLLPFQINDHSRKTFGLPIKLLWEDYQNYLTDKFSAQVQTIRAAGVSQSSISPDASLSPLQPKYDAKGNIYYLYNDGYSDPVIRKIDAISGQKRDVAQLTRPSYFDLHRRSGDLAYTLLNLCGSNVYFDLYVQQQGSQQSTKIGSCSRYRYVRWHPNGKNLFVSQFGNSASKLLMIDKQGKVISTLLELDNQDVIGTFAVSPDANNMAISLFRKEHGWELYKLDLSNNQLSRLTFNNDIEIDPAFYNGGKSLIFSSNQGGVFNIRRINIFDEDNHNNAPIKVEALTNVISLALNPTISPNGTTLAYSQLGDQGYYLHKSTVATREAATLNKKIIVTYQQLPEEISLPKPATEPAEDYSALSSFILPSWWLPIPSYSSNGDTIKLNAYTAGADVLTNHLYRLNISYSKSNKYDGLNGFDGQINYTYKNRLLVGIKQTTSLDVKDFSNDEHLYKEKQDLSLGLVVNLYNERNNNFQLLSALIGSESYTSFENRRQSTTDDNVAGLLLVYRNARKFVKTYTPVTGSIVRLLAEKHRSTSNSQTIKDDNAYGVQLSHYFNLGKAHEIGIDYINALREESIPAFRVGGNASESLTIGKDNYGLRGYSQGQKELISKAFQRISVHYTLPISSQFNGAVWPPIGIGKNYVRLYSEAVSIDKPVFNDKKGKIYANIIAEFNTTLTLGYRLISLPISIYYAKPLDDQVGETSGGLRINSLL